MASDRAETRGAVLERPVGRVKSRHYEDFTRMAVAAIRRQHVPPVPGRVVPIVGIERMSAGADIDNRLKALLDAIVKAGVIQDDSLVAAIAVAWLPRANGLSHVRLLPVQRLGLTFHPSQDGASGGWFPGCATPARGGRSWRSGSLISAPSVPTGRPAS